MAQTDTTNQATAVSSAEDKVDLPVRFEQTKFDWTSSEGAPKLYPMELISGSFMLEGGGALYIPNGATLHNGWGRGASNHIVGEDLKALPNRLVVSFFSYTENKFYSGDFTLPYKKILALFQAGHFSPNANGEIVTYGKIVAGFAPGGAVSVWLISYDRTVEVFFGYAKEEPGNWKSIIDNPDITREEFIQHEINATLTSEQISDMKKNGIPLGLWERYHKARYAWQPEFTDMQLEDNIVSYIHYRNGERDFIDLDPKELAQHPNRAVPDEVYFVWERPNARPLFLNVYFRSHALLEAFEKLAPSNLPLTLQFFLTKREAENQHLNVTLRNEKESIVVPFELEVYDVPEPPQ